MKLQFYILPVIIGTLCFLIIACKSSVDSISDKFKLNLHNVNAWGQWINGQTNEDEIYDPYAVLINEAGEVHNDAKTRQEYWSQIKQDMGGIRSTYDIYQVGINDTISYKIGAIVDEQGASYRELLILKGKAGSQLRELEVIIPVDNVELDSMGINLARAKWIELCNKHDPGVLVRMAYERDAIYYSKGKITRGTADITTEYDYMARPTYELLLSPLHMESVNKNIIYEIGQCSGSYGGKYMLLWRKDVAGDWMVLMDSNF